MLEIITMNRTKLSLPSWNSKYNGRGQGHQTLIKLDNTYNMPNDRHIANKCSNKYQLLLAINITSMFLGNQPYGY